MSVALCTHHIKVRAKLVRVLYESVRERYSDGGRNADAPTPKSKVTPAPHIAATRTRALCGAVCKGRNAQRIRPSERASERERERHTQRDTERDTERSRRAASLV